MAYERHWQLTLTFLGIQRSEIEDIANGRSFAELHVQTGMSTPTLKDIAQLTGVSTATASRVINGSHGGSLQVRTAVMRAVAALQYIPNPHATQLGRANGERKRTRQKKRRREPDVIAVRELERTMTQNADFSDLKSQILTLADENALLRRVVAELILELRQAKERTRRNAAAIRLAQRAVSSRT